MIKVKDAKGLTQVYIHAANIKVKKGDRISQGTPLGNPSCEYPPGGRNEGPHVHEGLEKDGQAIPIDGVVLGGWTIHNEPQNYDGTMTKPGEKTRTANTGRCSDDKACGGIRNDLPNGPREEVLGESTGPTATATAKSTETPKPAPTTEKKTPVESKTEAGWTRIKSLDLPYQIDYPSNWTWVQTKNSFYGNLPKNAWPVFSVDSEAVSNWITLDDYKDAILQHHQDVRYTATPNQSMDGQKAWRLDSTSPAYYDIPPTRNVTYITIKDGNAWVISFEAYTSEFNQKLPIFEKMLESFKFLK